MATDPFERAVELLSRCEAPALACHVHPDGDALGSMLALHLLSRAVGKASVASWGPPFEIAPHYRFLPGLDLVMAPEAFPDEPEVMVTFDCGSFDRLGGLAAPARRAGELIVLDHHDDNTRFGSVNVIATDVAATAVIVRRLAAALGWPLDRSAALNLYVGLVTDTGRFQYPNTTPDVFLLAEELSEYGLPIAALTRELFEKHRFAYVQLVAMALARAELDTDRRFVAAWLTADDLERYNVDFDETEGFIDLVRRTAEADVSCVLKEAPGEGLRVSLRSVSDVDVGAIAAELGGGGHAFMAGFISDLPIDDTIARVKEHLDPRGP